MVRLIPDRTAKLKHPTQSVQSDLEEKVAFYVKLEGLPTPVKQYKFDSQRKWRFDLAWPKQKVAVEVDGEIHHARFHQTTRDAQKRNAAVTQGWKVLTITGSMATKDPYTFLKQLRQLLCE